MIYSDFSAAESVNDFVVLNRGFEMTPKIASNGLHSQPCL